MSLARLLRPLALTPLVAIVALTTAPVPASASVPAAIPVPVIQSISAGYRHTCAVTTSGGVMCWGYNNLWQLGNGSSKSLWSPVPIGVLTLHSGVAAVSAGTFHTCALTTSGGVKCWGDNRLYQLGNDTTTGSKVPLDVTGLTSGVAAVEAGFLNSCALTTAGGVKCWGFNGEGGLGDGTLTNSAAPVDVVGLTSGVTAIATGGNHTCALTTSGGVKCWGYNSNGQLGNGTETDSDVPVDVTGLTSGATVISTGSFGTCALTGAGDAKCWGDNSFGQLGNGSLTPSSVPVAVSSTGFGTEFASISAGDDHTCALSTVGGLWCWGHNASGQLGDATNRDKLVPVSIVRTKGRVTSVSAGGQHTCIVTRPGEVRCWGAGSLGQLGDGSTANSLVPVPVFGPSLVGMDSTAGAVNAAGQITVTTSWTGVDPYADIVSYEAQVQTNGGPWSDLTLASPASTDVSVVLSPGNRYNFQIRITDSDGRVSVWIPGTSFSLYAAQDSKASYTGAWITSSAAGSWDGSLMSTTEPGASAGFAFHGRRLSLIGTKGPQFGSADVYLDGAYVGTLDGSGPSTLKRQVLFSTGLLRNGKHDLEVVNLATASHPRLDIDGFAWIRS